MGSTGSQIMEIIHTKCFKTGKWKFVCEILDHIYVQLSLELNVIETNIVWAQHRDPERCENVTNRGQLPRISLLP